MDSIKDILKNFKPTEDKYVSREFQSFGVHLAQKLGDERRKGLYIKLARDLPRPVLERALTFVSDSNARKKGALFMWKLKEMNAFGNEDEKPKKKKAKPTKKAKPANKKETKKAEPKKKTTSKPKKPKPKKRKSMKASDIIQESLL